MRRWLGRNVVEKRWPSLRIDSFEFAHPLYSLLGRLPNAETFRHRMQYVVCINAHGKPGAQENCRENKGKERGSNRVTRDQPIHSRVTETFTGVGFCSHPAIP